MPTQKWRSHTFRGLSFAMAATLFVSATASGLHGMSESINVALEQYARAPQGHFTQAPAPAFRGGKPGRDPSRRGGLWNARTRAIADIGGETTYASIQGGPPTPPLHSTPIAAEPGSSLPWEGTSAGVNTGSGNKLTALNLLSWQTRGDLTLDFTLYHNSQTSYNDELGHGWTWSYDMYLNLGSADPIVHWGNGTCIPYTAPGEGPIEPPGGDIDPLFGELLAAVTDVTYLAPNGVHDSLVEHSDGTWTLTTKDQTRYRFNAAGFLTSILDRNNNAITLTLNAQNYVTKVQDSTDRYYNISLDGGNNFQSITDHTGRTWTFTRNGSDDLTTVTWPVLDAVTYTDAFVYNASHDITTQTNRRGKSWTYAYNSDGSLASENNPLSKTTTYTYTSSYTRITNPLGKYVQHNYSSGKLASVTDESGFSESYTTRNADNNVTTRVNERGKTFTYTFDGSGNMLTMTNPLANTWTYTYNATNDLLTSTTPLGRTTTHTYDANGNLLTTTNPLNDVVETNTYNSYGLLSTRKNGVNKTMTYAYDSHGQLSTVTDPLSHVRTLVFDSLGRLTSASNGLGETESVAFDTWGRPVTYTHADLTTRHVTYNAVGQIAAETDELSHTKLSGYDNAGRLTSVTNARGDSETYGYDDANRLTSVTNGRGKTRTYTYTDRGDKASLTMPDGAVETWSYDGAKNVTAYVNPKNETNLYTYDNAGRMTKVDYPTGTDTTFGFNVDDERTSMVDSTGTTSWTLDAASQTTTLATPQGTLTYVYDDAHRRTSMTDATGTTTFGYDDASRLTSEVNPHAETTTYEYDNADRLTKRTFANTQYTVLEYDNRGRQTWAKHKNPNATVFASDYNVYDAASRLTSKTVSQLSTNVTTTFGYDDANQLTSESRTGYSATYTYDGNGNRLTKTVGGVTQNYAYDDGDKLSAVNQGGTTVKSYGYDAAGRTTSVVSSAGTTILAYDYEGRVTGITYPSSATNSFVYNGLDTRVSKVDSSGTKTYRRDGVDATDPVLSDGTSTYTPGISQRTSGASTFEMLNHLGTSTLQTDAARNTTATRTYDAFGVLIASTGTPKGPFGFAGDYGYQEDADSGLKLLGIRYYDASTGRFITRDPAKDGRNWYAYCDNDPVNGVDPYGTTDTRLLDKYPKVKERIEKNVPTERKKKKQADRAKAKPETINEGWENGKGPRLAPQKMKKSYGYVEPLIPDYIFISEDLLDSAEKGDEDAMAQVIITLEHELVHWADLKEDGKGEKGEPGDGYEKDIYGKARQGHQGAKKRLEDSDKKK